MKTEIEQYVIDKVKEMRIERGLSQSDLALQLDVTNGFIGKVESPKLPAKYNLNHINALAQLFNCSPSDFLPQQPFKND